MAFKDSYINQLLHQEILRQHGPRQHGPLPATPLGSPVYYLISITSSYVFLDIEI
jgi:hypothetical protein